MASQTDTGSRLWRGLRSLMFGEDSEPTLRDQIEEAIDDAADEQPKKGDLSPLEHPPQRFGVLRVSVHDPP